ncbi:Cyclic nucleotide-binding domain-containing protein [Pseudomonas sp. NFPP07]|nr:Cyclic nucleotide-binding domain-containing protein [Pseudomonas sp. NFPP07]
MAERSHFSHRAQHWAAGPRPYRTCPGPQQTQEKDRDDMPEPTLLNNEIRDWLMDCGLFDQLLPADFNAAAGYFSISSIAQGQEIFREGDAGSFMCIIHSGQVAVQKTNSEGVRVTIATLRSGRAFGEMAVLDGERRSASCVAASDCRLLNLGKDSLEKMLNDAPKIAAKIIRALAVSLSRRLRMADGQLLSQQV